MLRVVQVVRQQQCNGHCLCDCLCDSVFVTLSSTAVETAIAQCTSRWVMARGHRLNTSIVLAAVHGLSGLFGRFLQSSLSLSRPASHRVPVLNRPTRLCGRKATLNHVLCPVKRYCSYMRDRGGGGGGGGGGGRERETKTEREVLYKKSCDADKYRRMAG